MAVTRETSQQVVRRLFSLPPEEDILDDFACALKKKISIHGRLFCTDNFLCFYANILGFKTKQVIPFSHIVSIRRYKKGAAYIILIDCEKLKSFAFTGFLRRNEAFHFIYALWRGSGYCEGRQDPGCWGDNEDPQLVEEEKETGNILSTEGAEDSFETLKVIIPVSIQKFFELFLTDDCEFGLPEYCVAQGATELECTRWSENSEFEGTCRELNYKTENTYCHRAQVYQRTERTLQLRTSTKVLYSSCFVVEEQWDLNELSADKSMLCCSVKVVFLKNTTDSGQVVERARSDVKKDTEEWFRQAKEKCLGEPVADEAHQLAKYEEASLRSFNSKQGGFPVRSLVMFNLLCLVLLFFYIRYLDRKLEQIEKFRELA